MSLHGIQPYSADGDQVIDRVCSRCGDWFHIRFISKFVLCRRCHESMDTMQQMGRAIRAESLTNFANASSDYAALSLQCQTRDCRAQAVELGYCRPCYYRRLRAGMSPLTIRP